MMEDFEDFEDFDEEGEPLPEEASNRTFLIAAIGLGSLFVIGLVLIGIYAFLVVPGQRRAQEADVATIDAQNTSVALALAQTEAAVTATFTPTLETGPAEATETPVVAPTDVAAAAPTSTFTARPPTNTPAATGTPDSRTATAQAGLTLTAGAVEGAGAVTDTPAAATPTALPETGLVDDVGVPGMLLAGILLVVVLVVARRLRLSGAG